MIESTTKQLVGQRLKGPGMHWSVEGATAITALRAQCLNGEWHHFWNQLHLANPPTTVSLLQIKTPVQNPFSTDAPV